MSSKKSGKKRRFRPDGTPIWSSRQISGPGVWVMCVKGKERQSVGELYDLFERLAEELWPVGEEMGKANANSDAGEDEEDEEVDIEKAIAKEVQKIKRPRKETRFANCGTDTPCVIFISCKPPVDPVQLVQQHLQNVEKIGVTHTRHVLRLIPVSRTCEANLPEITNLCKRVVVPAFENGEGKSYRYKIEMRVRNHTIITKEDAIKIIADNVPVGHKVDLSNPDLCILVEIFKNVCGISVVNDYYHFKKYNVVEVAQASQASEERAEEGTE